MRALNDRGCRHNGRSAQCPAHEDRSPSLSFGRADQFAGVLVSCRAGCHLEDVLGALELTKADLFDEPRQRRAGCVVLAEYPYVDATGTLLFVKERRYPKDFRVRRPDVRGGWEWKLGDTRPVLYQLPAVLDAIAADRTVYVVEGERDVDALTARGFTATCNFDGAAKDGERPKWRPE